MEISDNLKESLQQGVLMMQEKHYAAAVEMFEDVIKAAPECREAYLHLGNAHVNLERYDDAIRDFRTALMLGDNYGELYYNIGNVFFLKGNYPDAIRNYNKAEENGYATADMYAIMSGIYEQEEEFVSSIRYISRAIELRPLNGTYYCQKIALQIHARLFDEAEATLSDFRELLPDALDAYDLSVRVYCAQEKFMQAREIAEQGISRFPNDPAMQLLLLRVYVESGKYMEAKELSDSVLQWDLSDAFKQKTILYKAAACAKLNQLPEAIAIFEQFLSHTWDEQVAYLYLNALISQPDNSAKLREIAEQLKEKAVSPSGRAAGMFYYVAMLDKTGDDSIAEKEYRNLAKELRRISIDNPNLYEVYIYRLLCHLKIKEYDQALKLADFLEKSHPELADGHLFKYHIYTEMGLRAEAGKEKAAAKAINPQLNL